MRQVAINRTARGVRHGGRRSRRLKQAFDHLLWVDSIPKAQPGPRAPNRLPHAEKALQKEAWLDRRTNGRPRYREVVSPRAAGGRAVPPQSDRLSGALVPFRS